MRAHPHIPGMHDSPNAPRSPAQRQAPSHARRAGLLEHPERVALLSLALIAAGLIAAWLWRDHVRTTTAQEGVRRTAIERRERAHRAAHPAPLPGARRHDTTHYTILSTADDADTRAVGIAVERLYAAHTVFFAGHIGSTRPDARPDKLQLTLYRDRAEFQANNRSSPWAEAYYRTPVCYAYVDRDQRRAGDDGDESGNQGNRHHWMIHEATHQLNREIAGFARRQWIEEGLATYFATSRVVDDRIVPGTIDADAYPIWWLVDHPLGGDRAADHWIPLRTLLTGEDAPPIAQHVNTYYIEYWSLTHFLFHHDGGRYADGYRRLIAEGENGVAAFERRIGPLERIEAEWYAALREHIRRASAEAGRVH